MIQGNPSGYLNYPVWLFQDGVQEKFPLIFIWPKIFQIRLTRQRLFGLVSRLSLCIFNTLRQKIKTLLTGEIAAGSYVWQWNGKDNNGSDVAGGIYFTILQAGDFVESRKIRHPVTAKNQRTTGVRFLHAIKIQVS